MELPSTADGQLEIGGRRLTLSNLERTLWPAGRFTKRDLIAYYAEVAPVLVPHLAGRPLTMVRFPAGVAARGFPQNECRGAPPWLRTAPLRLRTGETRRYCVVDDLASLLWVANLGTVELHPYLARADRPDAPVAVLLDLDPGPGARLLDACEVALAVRARLERLGLRPVVKSSGVSGLHVAVPLEDATFDEVRSFVRGIAEDLATDQALRVAPPDARARQPGQVLVDWRQNDPRRSTAAPYSLRATEPLGVSTPMRWSELEAAVAAADARLLSCSREAVLERIARDGDLFAAPPQRLPD